MTDDTLLMIITIAGLFGVLAALWLAGITFWSLRLRKRAEAIEQRLGLIIGSDSPRRVLRLWHDDHFEETIVGTARTSGTMIARVRRLHQDAGVQTDPGIAVTLAIGGGLLAGLCIYVAIKNPMLAVAAPPLVVLGYFWVLGARANKRSNLFDNQIIAALELVARSLRAGHPLLASFHLITEELDDPMRTVFGEVLQQHQMGVSLEESIQRVASQSTSADLKLFATAIAIQLRSGGNLADVMDRLAYVIRERVRLGRRVKVLTSQTQFSKRILLAFPIAMFLILQLIKPEYAGVLIHTVPGQKLIAIGAVSMTIGAFIMNRLAQLKY